MTTDSGGETTPPSPDEAFAVLGNEIRMEILRTLGAAAGSLSFSDLYDQVDVRDSGQFNYHLDQLTGHFVTKIDGDYTLQEPGRRVVEAILSGAITEDPELPPTVIDFSCHHCGAPVEVTYDRGTMQMSCTECPGHFATAENVPADESATTGTLANYQLPPADVNERTAEEVMRAAATWGHLDAIALASGVCPRCSAAVEQTVRVCEKHEQGEGKRDRCDSRFAVLIDSQCTNCIHTARSSAVMLVLPVPEMLAFIGYHGLNTTSKGIEWGWTFDEEVISTDPFEGWFTFTVDEDSITLTINDDLAVTDVSQS